MPLTRLVDKTALSGSTFIVGHNRLATNGVADNQPIVRAGAVTIHNGIVCNADALRSCRYEAKGFAVDTRTIPAIVAGEWAKSSCVRGVAESLFDQCEGGTSATVLISESGELLLLSNNGSLDTGRKKGLLLRF